MERKWHVLYYETHAGLCSMQDFIDSRKDRDQAKLLGWISLLEERGPNLPRPYADLLEDGIHELRIKLSGDQVRVLYYFCFGDFIILTHAFVKTTSSVPKTEISKALKCRADFLSRYTEKKLKGELNENL